MQYNTRSIATGLLDVVDIEFASCDDMVMQIKACAKKLVLPYTFISQFNMTPSVDFIVKKIKDEISWEQISQGSRYAKKSPRCFKSPLCYIRSKANIERSSHYNRIYG